MIKRCWEWVKYVAECYVWVFVLVFASYTFSQWMKSNPGFWLLYFGFFVLFFIAIFIKFVKSFVEEKPS
jgi:hypothetical protein